MKDIEIIEVDEHQLPRRARAADADSTSVRGRNAAAATGASPHPLATPLAVGAAALTALLAAVLAGAALLAWHSSARTVITTRTVPATVPVTADAIGCPVTANCGVSPMPLPESLSAIRRWNADAAVDVGTVVFDERGTPVHSLVTVQVDTRRAATAPATIEIISGSSWAGFPPSVTRVTIASQCVPHGAPVANSVRTDARSTMVSVTVGGRAGCSVVVTGAMPAAVLSRLAHAPELQL